MNPRIDLPELTVEQVRRKGGMGPGVRVAIWAFRAYVWQLPELVEAAEVEWGRLLREDRVEVVGK